MESKVLRVFYGNDCLPYKDSNRSVHFPIVGNAFQGANNSTEIRFYYGLLGGDDTTWVAVTKLPNGKIGSKVLTSHLDSELNEYYAKLELSSFYTQYKGDVYISLQGYQGGVVVSYDSEEELYTITGTPTIRATGSIKLAINYATQFVGSGEEENVTLQELFGYISNKLDINKGIVTVADIGSADITGYDNGQIFYCRTNKQYYEKISTNVAVPVEGEMGVLGSKRTLNRITSANGGIALAELYALYGYKKFIVNYGTNGNDYLCQFQLYNSALYGLRVLRIADLHSWYVKISDVPLSTIFSSVVNDAYRDDIASHNYLTTYYVPYSGANTNVDLGQHYLKADHIEIYSSYYQIGVVGSDLVIGTGIGDIWLQPDGYAKYITQNTFGGVEHEIANVDFVLDHYLLLTSSSGTLNASQYLYACRDNATIKYDGYYYKKVLENEINIVYRAITSGFTNINGQYYSLSENKEIRIVKSSKTYSYSQNNISIYNKAQAESKFATDIELSMNSSTYVLTLKLKDANGSVLATQSIDLPLESIITSATYYDSYTYDGTTYSNVLVIVLATTSVPTIIPVGSLIQGLEHEAYIEVSDLNTNLTVEQLTLAAYPNARIKYGNNFYLKSVETSTTIVFALPYLDVSTVSGHIELVKKEISVTKSSGAMVLNESTTSFYNKSQADALLNAKANSSDVYDKQAADDKFRTESQVDDQIDTKLSGLSRVNYIEDLEENKNYDYKFIVKEDGELVMRLTEVE